MTARDDPALHEAMMKLARHVGAIAQLRTGRAKQRAARLARDLKRFVREERQPPPEPSP